MIADVATRQVEADVLHRMLVDSHLTAGEYYSLNSFPWTKASSVDQQRDQQIIDFMVKIAERLGAIGALQLEVMPSEDASSRPSEQNLQIFSGFVAALDQNTNRVSFRTEAGETELTEVSRIHVLSTTAMFVVSQTMVGKISGEMRPIQLPPTSNIHAPTYVPLQI